MSSHARSWRNPTALPTHLLRPPAVHWARLPASAQGSYWAMVHRALHADARCGPHRLAPRWRRIAWRSSLPNRRAISRESIADRADGRFERPVRGRGARRGRPSPSQTLTSGPGIYNRPALCHPLRLDFRSLSGGDSEGSSGRCLGRGTRATGGRKPAAATRPPDPATRLQIRREFVFRTADPAGTALEIGPAHNAILPKRDGFRTRTVDYIDRAGLVEKYREFKQYSPEDIEDVDYVIPAGASMSDVIHDRFDLVLASHVLRAQHLADRLHQRMHEPVDPGRGPVARRPGPSLLLRPVSRALVDRTGHRYVARQHRASTPSAR